MRLKMQFVNFRTAVNRAEMLLSKTHNVTPPILRFMHFVEPAVFVYSVSRSFLCLA